jgi:hypothetical protein
VLYELTVVKLSGEVEVRYTDQLPNVGGVLVIDGRRAQIVSRHLDAVSSEAEERFVCRVTPAVAHSLGYR